MNDEKVMDEIAKMVLEDLAKYYKYIWDRSTFIEDQVARSRACNGMMAELSRNKQFSQLQLEKLMRKIRPEEPKAMGKVEMPSEAAFVPEREATPKESPPQKQSEAPTKPPVAPPQANAPAAHQEDTSKAKLPDYDRDKMHWNYCKFHPTEQIDFFSKKKNKPFQACYKCGDFLEAGGRRNPMADKPQEKA